MIERRTAKRLPRGEKTFLDIADQKKEVVLLDISIGGMRYLSNEKPAIGSPLSLKVNILPKAGAFFIKGRVSWVNLSINPALYEIGVKFTQISTIPIDRQ
jgi:Tfp pilus assembly protein PilZ